MTLFEAPEEERSSGGGKSGGKLALFLLAIPFVPALLFGLLFYWILLRSLKLRRSVSGAILAILLGLSYVSVLTTDAWSKTLGVFSDLSNLGESWPQLLYLLIPASIALGSLIGYGMILFDVRDIEKNPHRVELPGFWTYRLKWRKTPLELVRKRKAVADLKTGALVREDRVPLGYDEDADRVAYRFVEESVRHTLVTGAAGSGKTISMLSMMRADIESGRTVIAVDFKRSPEFAAKLAAWGDEFNIPFYHFEKGNPESYEIEHSLGQSTYDPFASGSGSEMILNMREYDTASAVYKQHMQQLLQVVFGLLEQADRSRLAKRTAESRRVGIDWDHGGIYQIASALEDANLKDLLNACADKPIFNEAEEYIPRATSGKGLENRALEELRGQMRTIVASAYGRWFKTGDGSRNIDLKRLITGKQAIALFSFNSEDEPELSRYVGSMIFADLRACSSYVRNTKATSKVTSVYVDEFQAVPPTAVNGLLEKARESKFAMTLAQQAFEQIITSSQSNGEAYLQSILVTCSNFLTHAGMTQDSAERVSKLLGKEWKTFYSRTNRASGGFMENNFSNRRNQIVSASKQEVWKVEPSEFMELSAPSSTNGYRSTAILVSKAVADPAIEASGTIARKLWMIPPQSVLEEYVTPKVGDEVDSSVQNLYADSSVSLLSAEEEELERSYIENTPVYREEEISYRASNETPERRADREVPELNFPDSFSDYDEDDDGDFGIEALEEENSETPVGDLMDSLESFDSAPRARREPQRQAAKRSTTIRENTPIKPRRSTLPKIEDYGDEEEGLPAI